MPFAEPARANLETVSPTGAAGWAFADGEPLEVEVWSGGRCLGRTRADRPRPDVASVHGPVGERSGFEVSFAPAQATALATLREIEVRSPGGPPIGLWAFSARPLDPPAASPFPQPIADLLGARPEDLVDGPAQIAATEQLIARLRDPDTVARSPVAAYTNFLRAVWLHFQRVASAFPAVNADRDATAKDYRCKANSPDELISIAHHLYVLRSYGVDGDFAEFGCFKGFSTSMLSYACARLGLRMQVFDSFEGLPPSDSAYYEAGDFAGSLEEVRRNVSAYGAPEAVTFHKGFFSDSLAGFDMPPLIGLWMDVDLESSARDVMSIAHRLDPRAAVFSHECLHGGFRQGTILAQREPDSPVPPILDRFVELGRPLTGRFLSGHTGAFWPREGAHPVLANAALLKLVAAL